MTATQDLQTSKTAPSPLRTILVLAAAAFFVVAIRLHLYNLNSQYYYTWHWQSLSSRIIYPILLPLAIPFFVGQWLYPRRPNLALLAIVLSTFTIMIANATIQNHPASFQRISDIVQSRWSTGFYAEAEARLRKGMSIHELLARYPTLLENFYIHPRQKPPGLIVLEMVIIRVFGPGDGGAMATGVLIAILASGSVLAAYAFILCFTENRDAAFYGASYFALCPSLFNFYPQFDQTYPILTACVTILWALALRTNRLRFSLLFGFASAVAGFITYLPGLLLVFLLGFTIIQYFRDPECRFPRIARHFLAAIGTFAASYFLLWLFTGFNVIATLFACVHQVSVIWEILYTTYNVPRHTLPWTIPTDLYDFALGSGLISYLLAVFYFKSAAREGFTYQRQIALLSVGQFLFVAFFGIVQTETSRIWIFMYPMLMLPIGLELAKWPARQRTAVYVALLLIMISIAQSMVFMTTLR
jgi:hypothetical protein